MCSRRTDGSGDHAAVTASEWFPGEGRNAEEEEFLAQLRAQAVARGLADVLPPATHSHAWTDVPLVVCAMVPGMSDGDGDVALQVGWAAAEPAGPLFVGEWNGEHDYLIDGWDRVDIHVPGTEATPARMADLAYEWLVEQLRHPVVRLDWDSGTGSPRSEWYFADSGRRLWDDGFRRRRSLRRPWRWVDPRPEPDRVTRLR